MKIIDPENLSAENQQYVKDGNPLFVNKYPDKKTGKLCGKDGRVIWDGKNFIFIKEKEKK